MEHVFQDIGVIVAGAALLAWLATRLRQPVIVAYLLCGVVAGPWGLGLVEGIEPVDAVSQIGITLLLFLAGMVLHPARLVQLFRKTMVITLAGGAASWLLIFPLLLAFGLGSRDAALAALALTFSSTILVVKLLPTTTLHQRHMGALCIAILVAQDLAAVAVLAAIGARAGDSWAQAVFLLPAKAALLGLFGFLFERWMLRPMMRQCDRYHEVLYILCLGWCLGAAVLGHRLGLGYESGAFFAGLALARNPASRVLVEELKPIRDFFLMFFFFVMGARMDLLAVREVWIPALAAAAAILVSRPAIYAGLFRATAEKAAFARETGLRLGQGSEFGLILAASAQRAGRLGPETSQLVQLAVIFTMMVSAYAVVTLCPTPLGARPGLKQD